MKILRPIAALVLGWCSGALLSLACVAIAQLVPYGNGYITGAGSAGFVGVTAGNTEVNGNLGVVRNLTADGGIDNGNLTVTGVANLTGGLIVGTNGTAMSGVVKASFGTFAAPSVPARTCVDTSETVTGAVVGGECAIGSQIGSFYNTPTLCYVSAANTVQVHICNNSGGTIGTSSGAFTIWVFNP